jgi:hypothetical protein
VSSDQVIKAGVSSDLLPEMQVRSRRSAPVPPSPDENSCEEFVIEILLSHGVHDDDNVVMVGLVSVLTMILENLSLIYPSF